MEALEGLLVIFFLIFLSFNAQKCQTQVTQPRAPALYVFGDSLVDNGNNNWLDVPFAAKANYTPYGNIFPSGFTGRATDGKTVPDFIAEYLGLPHYPPPYKQPDRPKSLIGYNYGSIGCGILPETSPIGCLDLTEQVRLFETTINTELKLSFNITQLHEHLSNSIFFMWMGSNDYLVNYFVRPSLYDPEDFAQLLISRLSQNLETLFKLGARKMVVFDIPALGCIPMYSSWGLFCDENKNANAAVFNNKLALMIQNLTLAYPTRLLARGKSYEHIYDIFKNPTKYGLTNVEDPCCGVILFDYQCFPWPTGCQKPNEYMNWDKVHSTQALYSKLAIECINNSTFCTPMNIAQLVAA